MTINLTQAARRMEQQSFLNPELQMDGAHYDIVKGDSDINYIADWTLYYFGTAFQSIGEFEDIVKGTQINENQCEAILSDIDKYSKLEWMVPEDARRLRYSLISRVVTKDMRDERRADEMIRVGKRLIDAVHRLAKTQSETFSKDEIAQIIDRALGYARAHGGKEVLLASGSTESDACEETINRSEDHVKVFLDNIKRELGMDSKEISTLLRRNSNGITKELVYEIVLSKDIEFKFIESLSLFNLRNKDLGLYMEITDDIGETPNHRHLKFSWKV